MLYPIFAASIQAAKFKPIFYFMAKQKYYVVWEGNTPGIYTSWAACQLQIKGYPNAKYKSFKTKEEADLAYGTSYLDYISHSTTAKTNRPIPALYEEEIEWDSIAVDAACSGNPGVMEYQGVHTKDKTQLFHQKFTLGTNNIGEFLAIVHALAMFKQQGLDTPIYTDSKIAMGWVKKKKCNTKLDRNAKTDFLFQLIRRAEKWLKENTYNNRLLKWETKRWGEIPADFGRK